MDARQAAFTALRGVSRGAYSSIAIGKTLGDNDVSEQDKALAGAIFYGVLEREAELDAMLRPLLSRPSKLEKDVRIILRMGLYQIAYMDGIPDRAAVSESVALAKMFGYSRASGLVNAVLRGYIRANGGGEKVPDKSDAKGTASPAPKRSGGSGSVSVPYWLRELWNRDYGEDIAEKIISSIAGKPPLYVRINSLSEDGMAEAAADGITLTPTDWLPGAAEVTSKGGVTSSNAYIFGSLYPQDISSQLCCAMMGVRPGDSVLDVCAAPGGKSFTMAQLMNGEGHITACDKHSHRVALIQKGAARLGIDIIEAVTRDALRSSPDDDGAYDAVLCDVPCSGLGVIRRKPDIMRKTYDEIKDLPALQYSILEASAGKVRPGGVLMYSTCTLRHDENRAVAEKFLSEHPEFCGETLDLPHDVERAIDEPPYSLTLFPFAADSDGFYMCKMRKKAGEDAVGLSGDNVNI